MSHNNHNRTDRENNLVLREALAGDPDALKDVVEGLFSEAPIDGSQYARQDGDWSKIPGHGFEDSNDTSGDVAIASDVWTAIPNDGAGPFSSTDYLPEGVATLFDASTGKVDPRELQLGDTLFVRNDFTVTPTVNGAHLQFRYTLGDGAGAYTLEHQLGTTSNGGGVPYRFQFTDLIYMGDTNTRDNQIGLEVKCSEEASLTNAGTVVQLLGRS